MLPEMFSWGLLSGLIFLLLRELQLLGGFCICQTHLTERIAYFMSILDEMNCCCDVVIFLVVDRESCSGPSPRTRSSCCTLCRSCGRAPVM